MSEQSIFAEAIQLEPNEQARFLEQSCAGNNAMRVRLERLIKLHQRADQFLESAAMGVEVATRQQSVMEGLGQQIGPYKLREKIGEGGFGVVYVAEQKEPVSRKVALKLIKPGMDSKDIIARFEAERQALAMMDHPNVAKVLDAGATESGCPYFVMELVHGVSITEYCDSNKLTNRQRLDLFIDVCHAVQHSHQKGIIHRDIKPSNVMVTMADHRPVVKVIDFGVAKALHHDLTDKSIYTGYGQLVGTPMYMSPEQAQLSSLDVDTRSDIYSLGVLLYELLTGTTPFDKATFKNAGFDEVRRIIREVEPRRPSDQVSTLKAEQISTVSDSRKIDQRSLGKSLRGELDWIVMKSLEKDRSRRYETAIALAEDVQRFLYDEPVVACPPSPAYKFIKFAKRRRVALTFAALITVFLLASIVALSISNHLLAEREQQMLAAKNLADKNLQTAREANQRADAHLQQLKRSSHALTSIFKDLNIDEIRAGSKPLRVVLGDRLVESAANIESQEFTIPDEQAAMLLEIGKALLSLGIYQEAYEVLGSAHDRAALQQPPNEKIVFECMLEMESALLSLGKYRDALRMSKEILGQLDCSDGKNESIAIRAYISLASVYRKLARYEDAIRASNDALAICSRVVAPEEVLVKAKAQLAVCLAAAGNYREAIPLLEESRKTYQRLFGIRHVDTLSLTRALATVYKEVEDGRLDDAVQLMQRVVEMHSIELGHSHPFTVDAKTALGNMYVRAGSVDEGVELLEQGFEFRELLLNNPDPKTLVVMNNLAEGYRYAGIHDKAIELLKETLSGIQRVLGPEHPHTQVCMNNLALNLSATGDKPGAIKLWRQCLDIRLVELPDHPHTWKMMENLAGAYQRTGKYDEALNLLQAVLEKERAQFSDSHVRVANKIVSIARVYEQKGEFELAEQHFEEALDIAHNLEPPDPGKILSIMDAHAVMHWRQNELDKSIPIFEKVLEKNRESHPPGHTSEIIAMANLGVNYKDAGRLDEGIYLLEQACELDSEHRRFPFVMTQLIDAYVKADRLNDAAPLAESYLTLANSRWSAGSIDLANALNKVAQLFLIPNKDWARAESLLRDALVIRTELLPGSRELFETQLNIGTALAGLKRFQEAETLLVSAHQGLMELEPKTAPRQLRIRESLQRLISLFSNWPESESNTDRASKKQHWTEVLARYDQQKDQ